MVKRKLMTATKPSVEITVAGTAYTITTNVAIKTVTTSFTLGEEYEPDSGFFEIKKVNFQTQSNVEEHIVNINM